MLETNKLLEEILDRIEKLEKDSHPPLGLCEFDGFKELVERITVLEQNCCNKEDK